MQKTDLKALLEQLNTLENSLPKDETLSLVNQVIGDKYKDVISKVKDDTSLQALDSINNKLDKFKQDFDLKPVIDSINEIRATVGQMQSSTADEFTKSSQASELTKAELLNLIDSNKNELQGMTGKEISALLQKITALENQLSFQDDSSKQQGQSLKSIVEGMGKSLTSLTDNYKNSTADTAKKTDEGFNTQSKAIKETTQGLEQLKKDTLRRFQQLGGGSMNRQIYISSANPLTKYTDVNLKPGAGTTITYANNDTTKQVDITITGGGAGSGITRSIATTTVSSTVGAVAITDYVVLANGGVQITLPTAVGNTNLYTVKNVGSSSVLVATTSAQTIDGSANLIMPVQYTSVDLISNNSNWDLT